MNFHAANQESESSGQTTVDTAPAPDQHGTGETGGPRRRPRRAVDHGNRWATRLESVGLVLTWIVMCVVFSLLEPNTFPVWSNFRTIFSSQTVILVTTLALVWSLSAGEFDLSVASVAGFSGTLVTFLTSVHGWPLPLAVVLALALGIGIGLVNALFIVRLNIPSLIMTLGMGTLLVGASIGIAGPEPVTLVDQGVVNFMNKTVLGLPLVWYIAVVIGLALYYVLEQMPLGRYVRFVGASRVVSRLSGIRVDAVRVLALAGSSFIGSLAGLLLVFQQGSSDPTANSDYLLPAFAAAFLGATAISPGRFNVGGAFVAVYFLVSGTVGFQLVGLSGWVEEAFYGASLIIGVAVAQLLSRGVQSPTGE